MDSQVTFVIEGVYYQYIVMPFELKTAPAKFSRVVVAVFQQFIHKYFEVYFCDWTVFGLLKKHIENL